MKNEDKNQFTEPIIQIIDRIKQLDWRPLYLLPSVIVFLALSIVLVICVILWPYGVFPIISSFIWRLMDASYEEIKGKSFANAMPYTVSIGIYFLIWIPFFFICSNYFIGFIGRGSPAFIQTRIKVSPIPKYQIV